MRFLLQSLLLTFLCFSAYADTHRSPSSSNSITGGGSYCQSATAGNVSFTYNTCVSGAGGTAFGDAMTVYWYRNSVNATTGGTLVATVNTTSATTGTGVITYTPSTAAIGVFYYYCIISYTATGTCGTGGTITSGGTATVNILDIPAAITGATSVAPGTSVSLGNTTSGGTWSSGTLSVATIDAATGLLTGVANGTSTISYSTGCGTAATTTAYVLSSLTWYQDNDGDGWGNPLVTQVSASKPTGYVLNSSDYNDGGTNAIAWDSIGQRAFTPNGTSASTSIRFYNNTPYVYYVINNSSSQVMKYSAGAWSLVGAAGFTSGVGYPSFGISSTGAMYVVYQNGYSASSQRFNGTSWVANGNGFTAALATYLSLAFDANDVPYMAYVDGSVSSRASVMKYNGTTWVQVGGVGFTPNGTAYTSLVGDAFGSMYMAFQDAVTTKATVWKYNGTAWAALGGAVSTGAATNECIAVDRSGTPYVSFKDANNKITVMKYDGTNWVLVGAASFSTGTVTYPTIAVDGSGTPYVAYSDADASINGKAMVMKFNGTAWTPVVTSTGLSAGGATYTSLAISGSGVPAVAYTDGTFSSKVTAMTTAPVKVPPTAPVITASPSSSCIGTTVTLTVASGSLNDATSWVWYKGTCGGTYVGTGTTISTSVTSSTQFYCRGENPLFTDQGDCGSIRVTITPTPLWYRDNDNDGWGSPTDTLRQCSQPAGYILNNLDCTDASVTNTVTYNVGSATISSAGTATNTQLVLDNNNVPYVYYLINTSAGYVSKYAGGAWSQVGASFTGNILYASMAINSAGLPYLAYRNGNKASCNMYTGSAWINVGAANFNPGSGGATYTSLAIDGNDVPYMAYVDGSTSPAGRASVMKYNGSTWVMVGPEGFTPGATNYTSLGIDAAGLLYVAYQDVDAGNKLSVMKYNGSSWSVLGSTGVSDGAATNVSLAVDASGTVYVLYSDANYSNKAVVKKYNGASWSTLGTASGFSSGAATFNSLKLDAGGNPFASYTDAGLSKVSVMKYNGSAWVSVTTTPGFTTGGGSTAFSCLALNSTGIPYIALSDVNNGSRVGVLKAAPISVNPTTPTVAVSSTTITCGQSVTLTAAGTLNNATNWYWYTDTVSGSPVGSGSPFTVAPSTSPIRYYARGEGTCLTNQGAFGGSASITVGGSVTISSDITGTTPICRGTTTVFSSTPSGGTWTSSNNAVATVGSTGTVTGVSAGSAVISYTMSVSGCGSNTKTKSITVERAPSALTGTSAMCVGGILAFTDSVSGGTWSTTNSSVASISATGTVAGIASGTANISYSLSNACNTNSVGIAVTVNPAPSAGAITAAPTSYCIGSGGVITLSETGTISGSGTVSSYNWSGPLGYSTTSTASFVTFTPTTSLSSGYYKLTVTYPGSSCVSPAVSSSYVSISPTPLAYNVTGGSGCSYPGVTVGVSNSQTGINYQLYIGGVATGATVAGTGSAISFGIKTTPGTYTVVGIGSASCTVNMTGSATVLSAPTIYTLNGGTACASSGVTITLSGSQNGITYQLYRGATAVSSLSGSGSSLNFGLQNTVGTYYITAVGSGGCTDTMTNTANVVNTLAIYSVTGGTGCTSSLGINVGLSGSQIGVSYQLYNGAFVAGSPVIGTGGVISFGLQTTAGTYTVIGTASSCTSQTMTGSATVNSSPAAYAVTGGSGCSGTGLAIGLANSAAGVNYQLYRGATSVGSVVAGTGGALAFGTQTAAGTYKITGTSVANSCITNMTDSAVVLTSPTLVTSAPVTLCGGTATTLTVSGGTTYSWSPNTGLSASTGASVVATPAASTNYTVTASGSGCPAVGTVSVTVTPAPVIVTSGSVSLCTGGSVTITASGATTYSWTPTAGLTPTTGASVVANPTTTTNYTVTGTTSGCSATGAVSVTVNARPTIASITASSYTLCPGATLTLSAGSAAGTGTLSSYNWTGPNSYAATSSTGSASLSIPSAAAAGFYSLSVTYPGAGCTSTSVATSPSVTVNALPTVSGITAAPATLCTGSVITLTAGTVTGTGTLTSYNWTGPNSYSITNNAATASLTATTTAASGNYSLSVTYPGTGCVSTIAATSSSVTVTAAPTVASITASSSTVCVGGSITFTAGATTGAGSVTSYNWSGPGGYSATSATSSISFTPASTGAAGLYSLSVNYSGSGCASASVVISPSVTVNARPTVASITASSYTLCPGGTLTLTAGAISGTGTISSYNWSGPNSYSVTGATANNSLSIPSTAAAGLYSLSVTYPGTGCVSSSVVTSPSVTVNASPTVASITAAPSPLCTGSVLTLTAGSVTGTGTLTSYNWTGPNTYGTTSNTAATSFTATTTAAGGNYSVSVTYPGTGCVSALVATSSSVTVNARPTVASITPAYTTLCVGTPLTLTAGAITGPGTVVSYNWSGPNGYNTTGNTATAVLTPTSTAASGVYSLSVTYSGSGCTSAVVNTASVTVNAVPTVASVTPAPSTLCIGNVLTLTAGAVTGTGTLTSYNWSGPNAYATTSNGATASFTATTTAASGSYSLSVTYPGAGCVSNGVASSSVTVTAVPTVASITSSTNSLCLGTTFTLTAGATTGSGTVTSYNWTGPNSYSATTAVPTIGVTPTVTPGGFYSVSVSYSGSGCASAVVATSPSVTVNARPTVATITPSSTLICTGSTLTLTAATVTGTGSLTSYNWTGPNSYVASGTTAIVSTAITNTLSSGFYSVTVTYPGTGCTSLPAVTSSSVTVNAQPTISGITASTACVGSTLTLTAGTANGTGTLTSYNWSGPVGYTATGTVPTATLTPTATTAGGVYTLSVTYPGTGCKSANAVTSPSVTVNPAIVTGTITGSSSILVGSTSTLANTTASGGTGAWTSSNTAVATVTTGSTTTTVTALTSGTATITYTVTNPCGSSNYAIYAITTQLQPIVTGVSPNIAIPGNTVTITGNNFNTTAGSNIVYFGATKAVVNSATASSLVVTVPSGATYLPVSVLNAVNGLTGYADSSFTPDYDNTLFISDSLNFRQAVTFVTTPTGTPTPYTGAIGDIDGDGKPDLVTNNRGDNSISIFLNTSTTGAINSSSFTYYNKYTTLGNPNNVKLADLDGDGKLDIVVPQAGAITLAVFRNTTTIVGTPTLATRSDINLTGTTVSAVAAIADFNGDGKVDIAVSLANISAVGVLKNNSTIGTISFAAPVTVAVGSVPSGMCVADFDGDGKMDFATVNSGYNGTTYSGATASVARNISTVSTIAFATAATIATGSGPIDIAAGDINSDGKPDLLVTNINDGNISLFRNIASSGSIVTGSFATRVNLATGLYPTGVNVGDLNGDGKLDVVVSNAAGTVSMFRNIATTSAFAFAPKTDYAAGAAPTTVTIGDLDGDKYPDVVVGNQTSNTISIIKNNPLPYVAPITGSMSLCAGGATTTLSNATAGGYWSMSNSNATVNSSGIVTGVTAGADTAIYTVVIGFDTNYAVKPITINGLPTIALGTSPTVCQSSTTAAIPYTSPVGSPSTYSIVWDAAATTAGFTNITNAAFIASPFSVTVPAGLAGVYNGSVTIANGCTSSAYPFTVTVLGYPTAAIASAPAPCSGYAANITFTGTSGASVNYSVDAGSAVSGTLTGGTYTFSTGNISSPHTYKLLTVTNGYCTATVDTLITITPVIMQWVGGTSGHLTDWGTATNWGCGHAPSATDNIIIPAGVTYMPVVAASATVSTRDITIMAGASLSLSTGALVNVKGLLINNAVIAGPGTLAMNNTAAQYIKGIGYISNLQIDNSAGVIMDTGSRTTLKGALTLTSGVLYTNDSLVIGSDSLVTGRIAPIASGASINGKVNVQQYIQGGFRRFRFFAHPFSETISFSQLQKDVDITGAGGTANGFVYTASNAPSAFRYTPLLGNSILSYDTGWRPITKITAAASDDNKWHPGQGIRLFVRGAKGEGLSYAGYYGNYTPSPTTINMSGHVNQGPVTITLGMGADSATQDYNLIGNPYPSPIDIGTIAYNAKVNNQITGAAFYLWIASTPGGGQFIIVPIGIGAPSPYYIGANVGFEVRADHNNATMDFAETNKAAMSNNYLFKAPADYVSLGIYDSSNEMWDMLRLQFSNEATDKDDRKLDATKPMSTNFGFYSKSQDGHNLGIDTRPYAADKVIPLGVHSTYTQEFTIRANNIAVPDGGTLYLQDKLLQKTVQLMPGTEYKFTITSDKATQGDNRFELSMKPAINNDVKDMAVTMAPNPTTDDVKITLTTPGKNDVTINVVDMNGVNVYDHNYGIMAQGVVSVPLNKFAAGIYMVQITSGSTTISRKLVKE